MVRSHDATDESFHSTGTTLAKRRERRVVRAKATDISNVALVKQLGLGGYTTSQAVRATATNTLLLELQARLDLTLLEQKLRKDLKGQAKIFWEWVRKLVEAKYGKTDVAFRIFACQKDWLMSSQQFQELCESIGLSIEPRIQKTLFELIVRRKSEMVCTFQDFQDALLAPKIDHIRVRMNMYNNSIRRIGNHVDNFMKRLALESGEDNRRRAFARLQKKMGIPFCIEVQSGLQRFVERIGKLGKLECSIHSDDFVRIVDTSGKFQQYELGMIRNIFDRIDRNRCSSVNMSDLVVALTLLASECKEQEHLRMEKLRFIFRVFDADNDGCLTYEEILRMFCSIAIFSTIARGDHPAYDADITLDDELSLAKARRLYDFCAIYLDQNGVQDLCTFEELWSVFLAYPRVMDELIPGTYSNSIMWVLRPLPPLRREDGEKRNMVPSRQSTSSGRSPDRRSSKKAALQGQSACKTPSASSPQLAASAARPSKTERFREQAAIRFRHAMRGEWDVVNHLQSEPPPSRQGPIESSPSRLPQLVAVAHTNAAGSGALLEKTQVSWAEASHKFDRRQGETHWQARHRQSITNWTRGSDSEDLGTLTRESRSLPNLRLNSAHITKGKRGELSNAGADEKLAELNAQESTFLESMPADSVRFGKDAFTRLKHVCKALQAGGNSSHPNGLAVTDCIQFDCHLCHGRHDVSFPCMA